MSWLEVVEQIELDAAAYLAIAADPERPLPPSWSPTSLAGPPPRELHGRLRAALARLQDAEQALAAARARRGEQRSRFERSGAAIPRYIDTLT